MGERAPIGDMKRLECEMSDTFTISPISQTEDRITLMSGVTFRVRMLFGGWAELSDQWGQRRIMGSRAAAVAAVRQYGSAAVILARA